MLAFMILMLAQGPAEKPGPVVAPYVKFDQTINAQPGEIFVVRADTNLAYRKWTIPPGLKRVPPEHTKYGDTAFVGYGPAGAYEFSLFGTLNDTPAEGKVVVFVGQPAPGPTPPVPPVPPNDPLFAELQALYTADKGANKSATAASLAALYTTAGQAALKDESVTTTAQFLGKLKAASKLLLPDQEALRTIRDRLAAEFALCLGKADVPLTPELRTKASECLNRLSVLVGALR